jgi:DNA-binding transcriptional LysR family regulator
VGAIDEAFALIRAAAEPWRSAAGPRTVRLSLVPAFARLWLLPRLAALQGEPADLRVELRLEHRLSPVDGAEADLAIRYGAGDWPNLRSIPLLPESLVAVASPALAARLAGSRAEDLLAMPLINDSDPRQWRLWFQALGVRYRPRPMDRRFEDYDMVLAAAEAGLGLALLRRPLGEDRLAQGLLVQVSDHVAASSRGHHIVLSPDEQRPEVGRLVSRLRQFARGPR